MSTRLVKGRQRFMSNQDCIKVEVIYLTPHDQSTIPLTLPQGATLLNAIHLSNILEKCPEIDLNKNKVGIFSKIVALDTVLKAGDRVEIYRPLLIDPKQKRLAKVKKEKLSHTPL